MGYFHGGSPCWFFSPFIVDASVTLIRRMMNRKRIWEAHRSHYYQRLVQMGHGHKMTVLVGWACIYLIIALVIHRHESSGVE